MAGLSLRQAATEAGTSKSTILRAVQAGRLSATRTDDGGYSIDPAELFRVYPPPAKPSGDDAQRSTDRSAGQDATDDGTPATVDLRIRNATLEAQIEALRAILDAEKRRGEELRTDMEHWRAQAERLALPAPAVPSSSPDPLIRSPLLAWWFRKAG